MIFEMIGSAGTNFRGGFFVRGCRRCESLLASRFDHGSPVSDVSHPPFSVVLHTASFSSKIHAVRWIWNHLPLTANPSWHWANGGVHPGHTASLSKGVKHRNKPFTFTFRMINHPLNFVLREEAGVPGENLQTLQDNELCPSQVSNPEPFCC